MASPPFFPFPFPGFPLALGWSRPGGYEGDCHFIQPAKEGSVYAFSKVCIITGAVNVLKRLGEEIAYKRSRPNRQLYHTRPAPLGPRITHLSPVLEALSSVQASNRGLLDLSQLGLRLKPASHVSTDVPELTGGQSLRGSGL